MDEIHVHKTKKSICAHFAESPCTLNMTSKKNYVSSYPKEISVLPLPLVINRKTLN